MILSAASPVVLNYGYDNNISINSGVVHTYDGVSYTSSSLLASALDVSVNNKQLLVLTDSIKLSDNITSLSVPVPESYIYSTLLKDSKGNYLYATDPLNADGSAVSLTNVLASATVFNFYFPSTPNTVQIYYTVPYNGINTDLYLVCNSSINTVSSCSLSQIDLSNSTYYYMLNNSTLSLISNAPGLKTKWLVSNGLYLTFNGLSANSANNFTLPASCTFIATRLNNNNYNSALQSVGQSDLVKYKNVDNELLISGTGNKNVPYNYLISSAYRNITNENDTIDANINTLKNYYTPTHDQGSVNTTSLRKYNRIFTGLSEDDGYAKVYLGYNSNVSKITFVKDTDTYFHYPYGTAPLNINYSTLSDLGSRADITPWRSDRIFKKNADYKNYSNWGNSTSTPQKGVYFCSWLSASNLGGVTANRPVWMDRYFDPSLVNKSGIPLSAMSSLSGILINSVNNYPSLIWDVPSTSTLEPGVIYAYHRVGDNDNSEIVNSITGLTYHIDSWEVDLINNVTGLTAGGITGYTETNTVTDVTLKKPYYNTNSTYGFINTTPNDFTDGTGTSLSFNLYQKDWNKIVGDQLIGNYFNGGVGLFNNNPILTPFFTVGTYTSNGGTIQTYNTELKLINSNTYNSFSNYTNTNLASAYVVPSFVVKDIYDNNYYVVDNYQYKNYVSTFDPGDLITNKVSLSANLPLSAIIVDAYTVPASAGGVDVVIKTHPTATSVTYSRFNSTGTLLASACSLSSTATNMYNNFVLDCNASPIWYSSNTPNTTAALVSGYEMWVGTNACVDSNNNVFALSANGLSYKDANTWVLTKNGTAVLGITKPEYVNCDQDNNIWITYNTNFLAKVDGNGNVLWTKQINTNDAIVAPKSTRVVNFLAESTASGVVYYTLIIDGKSQVVYKVNTTGTLINSISVPGLLPGGDSTGFDYQRKYVASTVQVPGIRAKLVTCDSTVPNPIPNYITLNYGTSALQPGWHNFAITFDQTNTAKLYVDGVVANKATILTPSPTASIPPPTVLLSINGSFYNSGSIINVPSDTPINATVFGNSNGDFLQSVSADTSPDNSTWTIKWVYQEFGPPSGPLVTGGGANNTVPKTFTGPATLYVRALAADASGRYPAYTTVQVNWAAPGAVVPDNYLAPGTADVIPPSILYTVYNYKNNPQLSIGTSNFKSGRLNEWLQLPTSYLFNGGVSDIRFYNIALNASDVKAISKNYSYNQFTDLPWIIPTGVRGYIEEIERFFLHKMPGSKSQFYDIKIKNSGIVDPAVKAIVESNLRAAAISTAPAYAQLRSIIWE
jgi:hypothetical protein